MGWELKKIPGKTSQREREKGYGRNCPLARDFHNKVQ